MNQHEKLSLYIDELRDRLENLIKMKENNLIDEEIIDASRILNEVLNKYSNLVYKI